VNALAKIVHPIFQAPIGSAASIELVAAVSNAGGCGSVAMTWTEPDEAAATVRRLRQLTNAPFCANFCLSFRPRSLDAVLTAGVPIVTFSWGISLECIRRAQAAGATVGVQIGSVSGARSAIAAGADFIICQGAEAGGHVQSTTRLIDLIAGVSELEAPVPLIAAGGLAGGDDVARVVARGADGVMLGTRFVATQESSAHPDYKSSIVAAQPNDTSFTWCFDGGWPYSGHRVIRNKTLEVWEAAGCPLPGHRPGENDTIAYLRSGVALPRYHMASPLETTSGAVTEMALYAGTGSARIGSIVPAAQVIREVADALPAGALRAAAGPSSGRR
jgi:nitronate monooxygenase